MRRVCFMVFKNPCLIYHSAVWGVNKNRRESDGMDGPVTVFQVTPDKFVLRILYFVLQKIASYHNYSI